jgi:hypothetical protein
VPTSWRAAKCTSFEQYVASAAVAVSAAMPAPLFSASELNLIARFYRVKSDKEELTSEAAADTFVKDAANFIRAAVFQTHPIYAATISADPAAAARLANMGTLVGQGGIFSPGGVDGRLRKALQEGSVHVVPRFFNDGFREGEKVLAVMYRNVDPSASPTELKTLRLTLAGGESSHLAHEDGAAPHRGRDRTVRAEPQ